MIIDGAETVNEQEICSFHTPFPFQFQFPIFISDSSSTMLYPSLSITFLPTPIHHVSPCCTVWHGTFPNSRPDTSIPDNDSICRWLWLGEEDEWIRRIWLWSFQPHLYSYFHQINNDIKYCCSDHHQTIISMHKHLFSIFCRFWFEFRWFKTIFFTILFLKIGLGFLPHCH